MPNEYGSAGVGYGQAGASYGAWTAGGAVVVTAAAGAASAAGGAVSSVVSAAGLELSGDGVFTLIGEGSLFVGAAVAPTVSRLAVRPPLELHAELVAADGHSYRWGSSVPKPEDVVSGVAFASKRYEGFERGSCRLARQIDRDYPDLGLFDSLNFIGYDGSVAYEGRVEQVPRSTPRTIDVEATGWMAHARDRKFREIYIDQDLGRWREPTVSRSAQLLALSIPESPTQWTVGVAADASRRALHQSSTRLVSSATVRGRAESWYDSAGIGVGAISYDLSCVGTSNGTDTSWDTIAYLVTDDTAVSFDAGTDHNGPNGPVSSNVHATAFRNSALLMARYSGAFTGDGNWDVFWSNVAVYGNHGLPGRGELYPFGFYASDIITDVCSRFCPKLNTGGVRETSYPIPHAVFAERTDPYDAWLAMNAYHLWELAVWENRTLHYGPADFSDYRWEVRASDPGVEYGLQGDSADRLANYAVVEFKNVLTGLPDQVDPSTHPELRDWSAENPLNRHGLEREFGVSLSSPTDPDGAAEIGRAALAENNQPSAPGTVTVRGHVRDRAGHWHPGWRVRAGDTIAVTGTQFSDRPRMVVEAAWDHSSKTLTIGVDSTLRRLDAYLDRLGTALNAAGLGG